MTGQPSLDAEHPGRQLVAIAPDDATDITGGPVRALWVGAAGDINVIAVEDTVARTIPGVQAGTLLPISIKRVRVTGTTVASPTINLVGIR